MSRLDVARPGAPPETADRGGWARRIWNVPLWTHLGALAVILVTLLGVIGTSSSFSADEGAAIVQARSLAGGDGWIVEHPLPEVDPSGDDYPLELSERGPAGFAPFGKHPLYAVLLAVADRAGGVAVMVLLSVAGSLAAAAVAAALARRLDPTLARPALWVTGLASPLLFDAYLVIAHTLGAALAGAAVLAAVVAIEERRRSPALLVVPLVAAAVLLRREAILFAVALAIVAGVIALAGRGAGRRVAGLVATGTLVAAAGAQVAEQIWTRSLLGGTLAWSGVTAPGTGSSGAVAGRLRAFLITWLTPGYGAQSPAPLALLAMLVAVAVGAFVLRTRLDASRTVKRWSVVAAAGALAALVSGPTTVVPGFLVAFPVAAAGLLLVRRETLRPLGARLPLAVFVLFALAVIATQYAKGGAGEWGGRYFALGIPFMVPVVVVALRDAGKRLSGQARRWALVSLAVCSLALSAMAVGALRFHHDRTAQLVAMFDRAGQAAAGTGAGAGARPVLVSTQGSAPRFAWSTFDDQRWLLSDPEGLADLFRRLRGAGVDRIAFVTRSFERDEPFLRTAATVLRTDRTASERGWYVLVLQLP